MGGGEPLRYPTGGGPSGGALPGGDLPIAAPYGIYAHAPWCRIHCPYCAFVVKVEAAPAWQAWLARCRADWEALAPAYPGPADTLFVGGGTPSLAPPAVLAALVAALPLRGDAEVSIEVNPGHLAPDALDAWRAAGVNRLSLGVQSFSPQVARRLGRGHSARQALDLARRVAVAGFRSWSVDLIFAVPGQTLAELDADLDALDALSPPHVSLYGLELHPGTAFTRARDAGRLRPLDDEAWRAQYERVLARLDAGGWERYEVSNFARAGHRARHNEHVWRGGAYAGIGPGAHGLRPDGRRTRQEPDVDRWLQGAPLAEERPDAAQAALDLVLTTLRHVDGLPLDELAARTGHRVERALLVGLERAGLLRREGDRRIALTTAGLPVADGVVARVAGALRPLAPGRGGDAAAPVVRTWGAAAVGGAES